VHSVLSSEMPPSINSNCSYSPRMPSPCLSLLLPLPTRCLVRTPLIPVIILSFKSYSPHTCHTYHTPAIFFILLSFSSYSCHSRPTYHTPVTLIIELIIYPYHACHGGKLTGSRGSSAAHSSCAEFNETAPSPSECPGH
jgi:hypothetical protein